MITQEYRTNRRQFSAAELVKYQGSWVAFSGDGRRIVASADTVGRLEEQLEAIGEDAQRVVFEWVASDSPEAIDAWIRWYDDLEPLEFTPQERAAWQVARQEQKDFELAQWESRSQR